MNQRRRARQGEPGTDWKQSGSKEQGDGISSLVLYRWVVTSLGNRENCSSIFFSSTTQLSCLFPPCQLEHQVKL